MNSKLTKSIILTLTAFQLFQLAFFATVVFSANANPRVFISFIPISLGSHLALLLFLYFMRDSFVSEGTGKPFERVNLANKLTIVRISTLPTILFLIILSRRYPESVMPVAIAGTALVFLTDLADGFVSRIFKQVSRIGRMLDSISDYCMLIVLSVTLFAFRLIPAWFFWLVLFRLFFQAFGMFALILAKRSFEPKSTFFGKAAVAATMGLYAFELFRLTGYIKTPAFFLAIEILAGAIIFVSIFDKAIALRSAFLGKTEDAASPEPSKNPRMGDDNGKD